MTVKDLLQRRQYPESFTDTAIEREKIGRLLESCRWVSSPDRLQCIELVVVDDDEIQEQFQSQLDVPACPVFISVLANQHLAESRYGDSADRLLFTEIGGLLETMLQQATEDGLCLSYMLVDEEPIKRALNIPPYYDASMLVLVGYAEDMYTASPTRFQITDITYLNEFGEKVKAFYDEFQWKGLQHYSKELKKKLQGKKGISWRS